MPLASTPGEDTIIAKLKEITGIDVVESDYLPDSFIPDIDSVGMFTPYMTVKFNGAFPTFDNGICGPEKDSLRANFTVYVASPSARTTRLYRDQVRTKMLTNFAPTDGSSLRAGNSFSYVDTDLGHHRYVQALSFNYTFNLS